MSFATDIKKPNLKKIVLFEIDVPLIFSIWINYQAGIWFTTLLSENQTITDDRGVTGYYESNCEVIPKKIESCIVDTLAFTKVTTLELCISTEESFYHDETNNQVYIHFTDWDPYINQIIRLGDVNGFCNLINSNGAYYNDIEYENRILSVPSLSEKKDPLFYGVQNFQSGNVSLINDDGKFDNWHDLNIYGQPARFKIGFGGYDYDDFVQVFEGFIESYSLPDAKTFSLTIKDKRDNLSRKIPYNQFTQEEFPDLNDDDVGKYKPLVFGYVSYAPVICLNKDDTSPSDSNRHFMFIDPDFGSGYDVNDTYKNTYCNAYIKNDEDNDLFVQVDIQDFDLDLGTFTVLAADIDTDNIPKDVFFTGFGYQDILKIIGDVDDNEALEFIINSFSNYTYNSTFFDTTEIYNESIAVSVVGSDQPGRFGSANIGLFIDKPVAISDIIGKIMSADTGYFYTQATGKFSVKRYNSARASSKTIYNYNWISDPSISYNTKDFLSSVTVRTDKNYSKNEYLTTHTNTDYENEVLYKYKKYKSKTIDDVSRSILTTNYAEKKAKAIIWQSKDIVRIVKRTGDLSLYDIDIMDIITASHQRYSEDELLEEWEVIGKILNLTNFQIELEMKYWGS